MAALGHGHALRGGGRGANQLWWAELALIGAAAILGVLAGVDPKLAVVGALCLIFACLVISDLAVGLALFAMVSFLDVLPFAGAAVTFAKAAGLLLALTWLGMTATSEHNQRNFLNDHTTMSFVLLALVGWAVMSMAWAESPGHALESAYRFALNASLFFIVYTAVQSNKQAIWVLTGFLVGAAIAAVAGILFPAPPDSPYDVSRLGGAGEDPNELAYLLVASIPIAAAFAAGWRNSPLVRVASISLIAFCVAGVFLSVSRSGLISLGVALLAGVVVGGRWRRAAAALLLVLSVSAVVYFSDFASPQVRHRLIETHGASDNRTGLWTVGWRMVQHHPVVGVGAGNFVVSSIHYVLEPGPLKRDDLIVDQPLVAHNIYLQVLSEMGVVGLAFFVAILGFSLACALKAARAFTRCGDRRMELLCRGVLVALLAILAADFFLSEHFSKQLWLLLALGPALYAVARAQEEEQGPVRDTVGV
jgi:O-antigen ligase